MFVRYILYTLWCLTNTRSRVVPYIAAENPDMSGRQAVTLSKTIMQGHKWECFVMELSFIGWQFLGLITFGLFNVLYTNPYKTAVFTQYYAQVRAIAKEKELPGTELLNDTWLYETPPASLIEEKYADVIAVMKKPVDETGGLNRLACVSCPKFRRLVFCPGKKKSNMSEDRLPG